MILVTIALEFVQGEHRSVTFKLFNSSHIIADATAELL